MSCGSTCRTSRTAATSYRPFNPTAAVPCPRSGAARSRRWLTGSDVRRMLVEIPRVLDEHALNRMRAKLTAPDAPWVDGRATAGHQGARVKANRQIDEASALNRELGVEILGALERNPLFISAVLPNRVYPPLFNRYESGMHFGSHVDGAVRLLPHSGEKIRTDVSITLFLNDPNEYDGGELQIEDT